MNNNFQLSDIFPSAKNECEVRSILDTDMYKFMMLDFILANDDLKDIEVSWKMKVRSKDVKTAEIIPMDDLINQLEMTKSLNKITNEEYDFLKSQKLADRQLFSQDTLDFLSNFKLSDYKVWVDETWNYELEFFWPWQNSMMWEIYWLKIINSLYLKNYILKDNLASNQINQIINETLKRLYEDIEIFKNSPNFKFSEFWTRRAMSAPFQELVYQTILQEIPNNCIWSSNVHLSRLFWTKPIWTNAHELRMIPTALFDTKQEIIDTMYDIDRRWMKHFPWLWILLPDTYGTSFYYENCPKDIIQNHNWTRFDSKDPLIAIPEYVNFLLENKVDPNSKVWIPSDWLDANLATNINNIHNNSLWNLSFWIGTNLSNNTKWTYPISEKHWPFWSFSVVIKPSSIKRKSWEVVSCVKLSDNPQKAMWETKRVEFFKEIFWVAWFEKKEVLV